MRTHMAIAFREAPDAGLFIVSRFSVWAKSSEVLVGLDGVEGFGLMGLVCHAFLVWPSYPQS